MNANARKLKLLGIAAGRGGRRGGAENGPQELRRRGLIQRLIHHGYIIEDLGDVPGVYETRFAIDRADINHLRNVLQVNRHTHACVLGTRTRDPAAFLLIVGGDHSLAIGALAGLADTCERLGLIWIDAHADFNTPRTSPSGNAHGMSLATACGYGHRALCSLAERTPMIAEEDVVLLGCREIDPGEEELLRQTRLTRLSAAEWRRAGIVDVALAQARMLASRCDHVHLSFDIDVLDPEYVPGTGTPVAAGLTPEEAAAALTALAGEQLVDSAEFVEYNPALDEGARTGDLTIQLVEALLKVPSKG